MKTDKIALFCSYSHKDEELRQALESHLSTLKRKEVISSWHDRKITAGEEWKKEIDRQLEAADIILLLISSDFIASDYCYEKELEIAMERHESNQAIVIPIILRPSDWSDAPFASIQALPREAQAVTKWDNEDEAWQDVVSGIKKSIEKIHKLKNRNKKSNGFKSMEDLLRREVDSMERVFEDESEKTTSRGFSTGIDSLDHFTDGLHPSELIAVAGRPGMGKTDFVVQLLVNAAREENCPVAYFSLNLSSDRITRKLISSLGRISNYNLMRGELNDEDWPNLTTAISLLTQIPLFIDDSVSMTIETLKEKVLEVKKEKKIGVVVIDSLQHLVLQGKNNKLKETPEEVTKEISRLARELNIVIVVTTSLSHDLEKRSDKRPYYADLGAWRSLEEDADTVLFLYRDEVYNEYSYEKGIADIIVAKNASDGPIGKIRTAYIDKYCRFENLKSPEE